MNYLFLFAISFVISFLGSIPLGSLNLTALQIYLRNTKSALLFFCLASALIEFIYSGFAIHLEQRLNEIPEIKTGMQILSSLVFFCLFLVNFFAKEKSVRGSDTEAEYSIQKSFLKGMFLSLINLQAIFFWIFLSHFLRENFSLSINSNWDSLIFALGVAFGTFLSLYFFAVFFSKLISFSKQSFPISKIIGIIFLCLFFVSLKFAF